jgi:aerobic carbon-monoxide dehydrogenase small subunit
MPLKNRIRYFFQSAQGQEGRLAPAPDYIRVESTSIKIKIGFSVNGETRSVEAHPMERLLDVLRQQLQLTGTKEGCGEGECGACSVFIDGEIVSSCLVPVAQVAGASIKTIEGVANGQQLHAVQQAFIDCGGAQCGICTPGMVMAAVDLLERNPDPSEADIRNGLAGNLCRCTGYMKIFESVVHACRKQDDV